MHSLNYKISRSNFDDAHEHLFWSLFIFRGHPTEETVPIVGDDEQDGLFYPAGPHRSLH